MNYRHQLTIALAVLGLTTTVHAKPGKSGKPGEIAGTVSFAGKAPPRAPLDRHTDPVCAKTPKLAEDVVVANGKLAGVHVQITPGTAGSHAAPSAPVKVVQRDCMYEPRVVGVMAGQSVEIVNGDATFHNVRGNLGARIAWNLSQPPKAAPIVRSDLGEAGQVVSLHCDVHPWMAAWAVISDHPYFDVTSDEGSFTLKNVPPGTYTVQAWHPVLGLEKAQVTVKPGKTAKASFTFRAKQ